MDMDRSLKVCPRLGTANDPDTLVAFPCEYNCCHYASSHPVVQLGHQQDFCLSPKFVDCPVFLRERHDLPLPPALRIHPHRRKRRAGILGWFVAALALAIL